MDTVQLIFIVFSVFSTLCSCSVLLTVIVFPEMRRRLFTQLIILMSFCEFVSGVASSFGFPQETSYLCPTQAFLTPMFFKANWLWTAMLSHQLYTVITEGRFGLAVWKMHVICWSISLVSTLLPLSTTTFGRDDDGATPLAWCFLEGRSSTELYYVIFTFYIILFGCLMVMGYYLASLYWLFRDIDLKVQHPDIYSTMDALKLYPLGMMIAWVPNLLFSALVNSGVIPVTTVEGTAFNVVSILATQDGTITAIIFFLKSREARFRWHRLLFSKKRAGPLAEQTRGGGDGRQGDGEDSVTIPRDFDEEDLYSESQSVLSGGRPSFRSSFVKRPSSKDLKSGGGSNVSTLSASRLNSSNLENGGYDMRTTFTHSQDSNGTSDSGDGGGGGRSGGWSKFPKLSKINEIVDPLL